MCRKMQESGLTEITPLMCTSALWATVQCFLIPSLLGYITGGGCRMRFNGCSILGLLIWQQYFSSHQEVGPSLQGCFPLMVDTAPGDWAARNPERCSFTFQPLQNRVVFRRRWEQTPAGQCTGPCRPPFEVTIPDPYCFPSFNS